MTGKTKDLITSTEVTSVTFEEISNPDSPFFDKQWFESELLPEGHEWFEIIGDFLFMQATIRRNKYSGKNPQLTAQNDKHLSKFEELIPDIEHFIRYNMDGLEFAGLWSELKQAYHSLGFVKREEKSRAKRGEFDRGTQSRKAWYAAVYVLERAKGKNGPRIKAEIAKFAELIKAGKIAEPRLWNEMQFDKILHTKSTLGGPRLNVTLDEEMNVKEDIPYYATQISPQLDLPSFDINIPAE